MLSLFGVSALAAGEWTVLSKQFSAVSIGIAFSDTNTGWTTFTDGSSSPKIVKTTNGGKNCKWPPHRPPTPASLDLTPPTSIAGTAVNSSGTLVMPTGFAAVHKAGATHVATVGLLSNDYSTDGNNFKTSLGGPFVRPSP